MDMRKLRSKGTKYELPGNNLRDEAQIYERHHNRIEDDREIAVFYLYGGFRGNGLYFMVGEILNQGGERLQNPSTPRLSTTTIFLKTIKERRLVLQVLLYNFTSTD